MDNANDWVAQPHPEDIKRMEERRFVRLTHDEVNSLMNRSLPSYELICAMENLLVEKNSINNSEPDSIDLQSRCRGDKL